LNIGRGQKDDRILANIQAIKNHIVTRSEPQVDSAIGIVNKRTGRNWPISRPDSRKGGVQSYLFIPSHKPIASIASDEQNAKSWGDVLRKGNTEFRSRSETIGVRTKSKAPIQFVARPIPRVPRRNVANQRKSTCSCNRHTEHRSFASCLSSIKPSSPTTGAHSRT